MRYTARTLTDAARPIILTIGRVSNRRGFRHVSAWFVRRFRTWEPKPISVPQMLLLQASAGDPVAYVVALSVVLRAVFPVKPWYRLTGDPVALITRLFLDPGLVPLGRKVLTKLVQVPGGTDDMSTQQDDPVEAIRRAQRAEVYGEKPAHGPSLATAAMTVRAAYGDAWYYAPDRWPTSDGYAPFAVCWVEFVGLQALDARRRLEVADGYALAHAKDPKRARRPFEQMAYPAEVC